MSASDEEAFASAEEGEGGAKAAPEKSSTKKESSKAKSQPAAAKDKGGGKQKAKQQQQRKKKPNGESKPAADKKEESTQKKTKEENPIRTDKAEVKEDVSAAADESKKEEPPASPSPSAHTASPAESSGSVESAAKDSTKTDSSSDKKDSISETETVEKDKEKSDKSVSETPGKSAGEIRQSLSSSTTGDDSELKNPSDQAIPRDVSKDSRQEESKQKPGSGDKSGGGWGWGWGSSLLDAATNSLETFSSQVGEGLTTIIDSVESSLGVPSPEEVARAEAAVEPSTEPNGADPVTAQPHEKEASEEVPAEKAAAEAEKEKEVKDEASATEAKKEETTAQGGGGWLSGWGMSNISNMGKTLVNKSQNLMTTGFEKAETLAAGGLDILETIGKKTYTTLTEHDPGLRRAREFLHLREEKPSLSSVLREAHEEAEEQAKRDEESEEARKYNFTALFEDNQGLAHLEALEMLSNRSERKVQSLLSAMEEEMLENIRPQLIEIKDTFQQAFETEDQEQGEESEHDFSKLVTENLSELHMGTAPDKLNKVQETVRQWIADFYSHEDHSEISDAKEVQLRAIQSLADVTSKAVEQFHKAGELVLIQKDEDKTFTHRAQSLAKLSSVLVTEVDILATKFSHCLNKIGEEKNTTEEVNPMVTCVYLEASNASGYIQDAFQLLLPVLQHAAIQSALTSTL